MPRQILFALAALASLAIVPHAAGQAAPQAPAPAPAVAAKPNDYTADSSWLCRPGRKGDACDIDLATTVVAANGTLTRETWAADPKPAIDCFYVYPTISTDPGVNSDMTPDPAELNVVAQQFARFGSKCRVFAPSYRQVTLTGLRTSMATGNFSLGTGLAYDDVRDAWNSYLQRDNQGRGVALIGHSQGSFVLIELIKKEIEGKPVQKRIVSAILLGATVEVPTGKDVGGTFQQMPLCRAASQTGCVITYGSYRSTVPPPESALFGVTTTAGMSGACTNPANLKDGGPAPLHSYLSAAGRTVTGTTPIKAWVTPDTPITTPWVSTPGLLTARCTTNQYATFLEVTVNGDPNDPRVDDIVGDLGLPGKPIPNWGLHLVDVNISMGNLVAVLGQQAQAYTGR